MKAFVLFVSSLLLTSTTWANLENETCASFARGAAESKYIIEAGAIQGHGFESNVVEYKESKKAKQAEVLVSVLGYNEDHDTWTMNYTVVVNLPNCSIEEIYEGK